VNYIHEQVVDYPDGSVIKKILSNKMEYLESYRQLISNKESIAAIRKYLPHLESFLDML
jgi:hypothetical protein